MAEPKTRKTGASVAAFLDAVENETRRADARAVAKLLREVTGKAPAMWGPSIVGYGAYRSASGEWPIVGFSPRKANLVLYIATEFPGRAALLGRLGKHRTGVSCVYVNRLADLDMGVLRELVAQSVAATRKKHG
jgi:hypothetical protein